MGSVLFEWGGFSVPFLSMGLLILLLSLGIPTWISSNVTTKPSDSESETLDWNLTLKLITKLEFMYNFVIIIGMAAGFGVIFGTLEPFLRHTVKINNWVKKNVVRLDGQL